MPDVKHKRIFRAVDQSSHPAMLTQIELEQRENRLFVVNPRIWFLEYDKWVETKTGPNEQNIIVQRMVSIMNAIGEL